MEEGGFLVYFLSLSSGWGFLRHFPRQKITCEKTVRLQPRVAPFAVAVVGTEEIIRELMGLDRWQDQTRCPMLGCFVATLALLDLSHVLFFAVG